MFEHTVKDSIETIGIEVTYLFQAGGSVIIKGIFDSNANVLYGAKVVSKKIVLSIFENDLKNERMASNGDHVEIYGKKYRIHTIMRGSAGDAELELKRDA